MTCYQHNPMKRTPSSLSSACVELCEKKIQRQLKTKIQRTQTIHDKERRTKSDFNFCFFFTSHFVVKALRIVNALCGKVASIFTVEHTILASDGISNL